MKQAFIFIVLFSISLSNYAQIFDTLDLVNISNNRIQLQSNSQTGKDIQIINMNKFSKSSALSIDDLLKFEAGIEIQQRGAAGSQADIIIRGSTFQQILILIDGVKLNDPITGHFSGYIPVAPGEIERIEILKGPAAAMFGSEAVGGVIHIITKTFFTYQKTKSSKTKLQAGMGEYALTNFNASTYVTGPRINFSAGILSNNTRGQRLRSNNLGYFYNNTFSASLSLPLGKNWTAALRSSYDMRDFAAQNYYTTFGSDTATEKVNTSWNQLKIKRNGTNAADQFDLAYKTTTDNYLYNSVSIANNNKSEQLIFNYLHNQNWKKIKLSSGISYENKKIISNDRGNHQNNSLAVFSTATYQAGKFYINPGARLVNDQNYGTVFIPQLNLSFVHQSISIRAGAGKAIRAADFTERFNNYNKPIVRGGSIGNPNLSAEQSTNIELGADFKIKNFRASATGFIRDQQNVIDYIPTPFNQIPRNINLDSLGKFSYAKNVKTVNTKGLELNARYSTQIAKKVNITAQSSLTWLDSKTSDSIPTFYILSHAKLLWQNNISIKIGNLEVNINSIYKERNASQAAAIKAVQGKSYMLIHTKIQYSFNQVSAYLNIQNIGDISYTDLLGSRMPKRWISAGISAEF
jgi:iron complex outermembrane receptor protein